MQFFTTIAAALAASQTVSSHVTAQPADATACAYPTATSTNVVQRVYCHYACLKPSRTCSPGEPTRIEPPKQPFVVNTRTPSPGACTAVADAVYYPGCNHCPTCLPAPVAAATQATALAAHINTA